jgi:hypothetical protein
MKLSNSPMIYWARVLHGKDTDEQSFSFRDEAMFNASVQSECARPFYKDGAHEWWRLTLSSTSITVQLWRPEAPATTLALSFQDGSSVPSATPGACCGERERWKQHEWRRRMKRRRCRAVDGAAPDLRPHLRHRRRAAARPMAVAHWHSQPLVSSPPSRANPRGAHDPRGGLLRRRRLLAALRDVVGPLQRHVRGGSATSSAPSWCPRTIAWPRRPSRTLPRRGQRWRATATSPTTSRSAGRTFVDEQDGTDWNAMRSALSLL